MVSTKCIFMALRRFSGTSARSFSLSLRKHNFEKTGAMGGQQFFFKAADGQNFAAQRDFAGHGEIAANRNLAKRAGNCRSDRDACRWAIFRNGAFGHVHVQIEIAIEVAVQAQPVRARANVRHGSLR